MLLYFHFSKQQSFAVYISASAPQDVFRPQESRSGIGTTVGNNPNQAKGETLEASYLVEQEEKAN